MDLRRNKLKTGAFLSVWPTVPHTVVDCRDPDRKRSPTGRSAIRGVPFGSLGHPCLLRTVYWGVLPSIASLWATRVSRWRQVDDQAEECSWARERRHSNSPSCLAGGEAAIIGRNCRSDSRGQCSGSASNNASRSAEGKQSRRMIWLTRARVTPISFTTAA